MDYNQAIRRYSPQSRTHGSAPVLLKGRLLTIARAAWLLIAALSGGLFLAAVPFHYRQLLDVCVGSECAWMQLSPPEVVALQNVGFSPGHYAAYSLSLTITWALVYAGVALVIFWRRSREWMALLAALWLVTFGTMAETPQALAASQSLLRPLVYFLGEFGWAVLLPLFLLTFPDGRFTPRWTRWLFVTIVVVGIVGNAIEHFHFFPHLAENRTGEQVVWFSMMFTGIGVQVYRYRRVSDPEQRQQTKWVVSGLVVVALGLAAWFVLLQISPFSQPGLPALLDKLIQMTLVTATFLIVALTIGFSILRYRLWDIDVIINRTLVYAGLTAIVIGIYVVVVGLLGLVFQTQINLASSLLATGLVAVLFQPLRERLQRGVNRLMFGQRDDPVAMLTDLARQLETAGTPEAVLPALVQTVAAGLKLPYVALWLPQTTDQWGMAADVGKMPGHVEFVPLLYQKQEIGRLVVAPRSPGEKFSRADESLLATIAQLAATTVRAVQLSDELRHSRQQIVTGREEERRRIRRDLHDGLGPVLASLALEADTAQDLVQSDPDEVRAILADITAQAQTAVSDIRRLVYDLRPPALDELGLVGATRQHVAGIYASGLSFHVDLPQTLPPLSAAVEVAAYRITQEALNNVVRHAGATTCTVRLAIASDEVQGVWSAPVDPLAHSPALTALQVEIVDNGRGIPPESQAGVGLPSMRERAAELGGRCTIESLPAGGTQVMAWLPYLKV
jgi:signal transduction histidine kinase